MGNRSFIMNSNLSTKDIQKNYDDNDIIYDKNITLEEILKVQKEQFENLYQDFSCNPVVSQVNK